MTQNELRDAFKGAKDSSLFNAVLEVLRTMREAAVNAAQAAAEGKETYAALGGAAWIEDAGAELIQQAQEARKGPGKGAQE